MPSSNKTQNYRLNRWLGSDKPKKDDFNEDNLAIDSALAELQGNIAQASSQVAGQIAELGETVSQNQQVLAGSISTHTQNSAVHITAAERSTWNGGSMTIGTYQGDNSLDRKITLGYQPKIVFIFADNTPIVNYSNTAPYMFQYCAVLSSQGCMSGFSIASDGFSVRNSDTSPVGFAIKLNESGKKYVYIVWR